MKTMVEKSTEMEAGMFFPIRANQCDPKAVSGFVAASPGEGEGKGGDRGGQSRRRSRFDKARPMGPGGRRAVQEADGTPPRRER